MSDITEAESVVRVVKLVPSVEPTATTTAETTWHDTAMAGLTASPVSTTSVVTVRCRSSPPRRLTSRSIVDRSSPRPPPH